MFPPPLPAAACCSRTSPPLVTAPSPCPASSAVLACVRAGFRADQGPGADQAVGAAGQGGRVQGAGRAGGNCERRSCDLAVAANLCRPGCMLRPAVDPRWTSRQGGSTAGMHDGVASGSRPLFLLCLSAGLRTACLLARQPLQSGPLTFLTDPSLAPSPAPSWVQQHERVRWEEQRKSMQQDAQQKAQLAQYQVGNPACLRVAQRSGPLCLWVPGTPPLCAADGSWPAACCRPRHTGGRSCRT